MSANKQGVLVEAVNDLAALLDYVGKTGEADELRSEILTSGRVRGLELLAHLNRIRVGIRALRTSSVPVEAREAVDDVVARIQRALPHN